MNNYTQYIKNKLLETIQSSKSLKTMYIRHANADFMLDRKLIFETMIKGIVDECRQAAV